ncbi:IS3 family transposase, partial [Nitrosomonas ureae]
MDATTLRYKPGVEQQVYQLIKANRAQFPARVLCETLGVSHSGYYDWAKRTPSRRAITNCRLIEQIMAIYRTSDCTYGRPRITVELADRGVRVNHKRVGRLMREAGIKGVSRRRGFVITTHRNKRDRPTPDLVQRHFKAASINQLWVADMTYIPTWAGFL